MSKFNIDFEIVTPMFIAGNNQKKAEFRLSSFKGVLRFWYRAVSFPSFQSIKKLKGEEDEIFGSTKKASKIVLTLDAYRESKRRIQFRNKDGLIYLAYGVVDKKRNISRGYISPSTTGRISISYRNLNKTQLNRLKMAITAFALFGNMGSRSRKGYGSINFSRIKLNGKIIYRQPRTTHELETKIRNFCMANKFAQINTLPPFSAFSSKSRIDVLDNGTNALDLLNSIGEQMVLYRSWGRRGRVVGKPSEKNFKFDHDLIKNMQFGKKPSTHPKRVIFGLPHNYYFGSTDFRVNVQPDSKDITRRASPLILKIHKLGERTFVAVSLILHSQFLPQGTKIKISSRKVTDTVSIRPEWKILTEFIEGNNPQGKARFPIREMIFP